MMEANIARGPDRGLNRDQDRRQRQSYAQWVGKALALARQSNRGVVSLFESSVPEPKALVRDTIARMAANGLGDYYVSAFAGGNPFVLDKLVDRYGVARDGLLCTTGATGGLSLIVRAFGAPGAHALVETPGFDLFGELARDRGMQVDQIVRRGPDYAIDPAEVEAMLRPDTRLIILSNLHNPSGHALAHDVLVRLAAIAERHGVLLVVDEVYGDYARTAARPCAAAALSPAVISVSSLTKIFGLATLRCGWIVAAPAIVATLRDVDSRLDFSRSNLAHAVAAEVFAEPAAFEAHTAEVLGRSRPIVEEWFAAMRDEDLVDGALPQDGCIFFPRLVGIDDTEGFADRLIQQRGVIVAPGEYFGAAGHVRIGFGMAAEPLGDALAMLTEALRAQRDATYVAGRAYAAGD